MGLITEQRPERAPPATPSSLGPFVDKSKAPLVSLDIKPGTILYLPPRQLVPKSSVLYTQYRTSQIPFFAHPVLVLSFSVSETGDTNISFLPVTTLSGDVLNKLRDAAPRMIWPQHFLINESWCQLDENAHADDPDYQSFPCVKLGRHSLRTKTKHWIFVDKVWKIEAQNLMPYPPPTAPWMLLTSKGLPNPRVYIDDEHIDILRMLVAKYTSHAAHIPPSLTFPPPAATDIRIGHVYTLPLCSASPYLNQAQGFSFFERPLGKPFLVTDILISSDPKMHSVRGFILTSFHGQPITSYFPHQDDKTRWIRGQYLPVEGPRAEMHDGLPVVLLGKGSRRVGGETLGEDLRGLDNGVGARWYVHGLKCYGVTANEVLGKGEAFVREDMVGLVKEYYRVLRAGRLIRRGKGEKMGWGDGMSGAVGSECGGYVQF